MPLKRRTQLQPDAETDIDSGFYFPHMPLHVHKDIEDDSATKTDEVPPNLSGDKASIALLLLLYVLQGIPLGLAGSIPLILQSRKISYTEQAMFSFVYWPFSVKLLWAPIVDAAYLRNFGRRKTWLVPTQYLIGAFMMYLSRNVGYYLGDDGGEPKIFVLTVMFFMLNFLAATQDIAVDGWALTMLSRRNVGYASTCNSVGQTAGYFLGNIVFLALESPDFCNKYLRSAPVSTGLVTLSGFLWFWGITFLLTTTLIWLLKRETEPSNGNGDIDSGIIDTYKLLINVIKLPSVTSYVITLLTCKVGFAAADGITGLKLIEAGVPKDRLALLGIPIVPLQILLPWVISKYITGPRPMDFWLKAIPYRLLIGLEFAVLVYWTKRMNITDGNYPYYYYIVILLCYGLHQTALYTMFVSCMAFNAQVSDPTIGGSYMTLLNTVSNLGGNWPSTLALWLVDGLTWTRCIGAESTSCYKDTQACTDAGGMCHVAVDGYYVESVICFLIGIAWWNWRKKSVRHLQNLDRSSWKVTQKSFLT